MDQSYTDPRLTKVLKQALTDAKSAYECLVKDDLDNTKLHLANLIGVQYTLYELYRDEIQVEQPSHDPLEDIQVKTERFFDKFKTR